MKSGIQKIAQQPSGDVLGSDSDASMAEQSLSQDEEVQISFLQAASLTIALIDSCLKDVML